MSSRIRREFWILILILETSRIVACHRSSAYAFLESSAEPLNGIDSFASFASNSRRIRVEFASNSRRFSHDESHVATTTTTAAITWSARASAIDRSRRDVARRRAKRPEKTPERARSTMGDARGTSRDVATRDDANDIG